jgi:hypothetical protein
MEATLPDPFRESEVEGRPNALYVDQRAKGANSGKGRIPICIGSARRQLERPEFVGSAEFGGDESGPSHVPAGRTGALEQSPHNCVHDLIGAEGGWDG